MTLLFDFYVKRFTEIDRKCVEHPPPHVTPLQMFFTGTPTLSTTPAPRKILIVHLKGCSINYSVGEGGGRQLFFGGTTLRNHASSSRSTLRICYVDKPPPSGNTLTQFF